MTLLMKAGCIPIHYVRMEKRKRNAVTKKKGRVHTYVHVLTIIIAMITRGRMAWVGE